MPQGRQWKSYNKRKGTRAAYCASIGQRKSTTTQSGNTGKCRRDHSDTEEVHRSVTADAIDFKERDSKKDPEKLAIDKNRKGGDIHS
eukprot:12086087-Heterocapsa_arctica.AAC.1